ncbi:MAG: 16S rRNA (guanine(966)-N(2))-methyltransferase RsmD [Vicinamibacterales bacterium]
MRIIAGTLKGRRLQAPDWPGLRPTSDKVRETLFNILGASVAEARVLDGYAGTGAVGIEALSRGARAVTFVERDRRAAALIEQNLQRCGVSNGYVIIRAEFTGDARARLRQEIDQDGAGFDVIVLDPPYDEAPDAALDAAAALAAPAGLVVLEHARRHAPPEHAGRLARRRTVVSGDSALTFYSA